MPRQEGPLRRTYRQFKPGVHVLSGVYEHASGQDHEPESKFSHFLLFQCGQGELINLDDEQLEWLLLCVGGRFQVGYDEDGTFCLDEIVE